MDRAIDRVSRPEPPRAHHPSHAHRGVVPHADFAAQSPFISLSEDWFAAPAGFPTHPHRGMQTVTFVLEGALEHKDHTGAHSVLRAGDVQWMTAGHGVLHSELPHGTAPVHTLQLWLNLPAAQKMIPARYVDQRADSVPMFHPPGAEVRVYAGRFGAIAQAHGSDYPMSLLDLRLEAGAELTLDIPAAERAFLYVLGGGALAGGRKLGPLDVAWSEPGAGDRLVLRADAQFRALLFHGTPIDEPVVAGGPFVMNSEDEIAQAFEDYRKGRLVA